MERTSAEASGLTTWIRYDISLQDGTITRQFRKNRPLTVLTSFPSSGVSSSRKIRILNGGDHTKDAVYIGVPAEVPSGAKVTPVVDISMRGCHPIPFTRYSEIGPWSNWDLLQKMGIRVEWQDASGQWKTQWCQDREPFQLLEYPAKDRVPGYDHASTSYVAVIAIYNALMQANYPKGAVLPEWLKQEPSVAVKQAKYDHLTQSIELEDQERLGEIPVPTLVDYIDNELALYNMNRRLRIPLFVVGEFAPYSHQSAIGRQRNCDMCRKDGTAFRLGGILGDIRCEDSWIPKDSITGEDHLMMCHICHFLRRPCTWTQPEHFINIPDIKKFLVMKSIHDKPPLKISGPLLTDTKSLGSLEEELEHEDGPLKEEGVGIMAD